MKKFIQLLFVISLFFACKNTTTTEEEAYFCGAASSENTNIIVGNKGSVLKNTSSSITWEKVELKTDKTLMDACYDGESFYIAGHNGTVFSSADDGATWHSKNTKNDFHIFGIASNKQTLVAVGYNKLICMSQDGGSSWEEKYKGNKKTSFFDVCFGKDKCIAVGDYSAVVIIDNSTNVTSKLLDTEANKKLKGIAFYEQTNRWVAVGHEGVIFVSDDDGLTWSQKNSDTTEDLLSIAFNGKRFIIAGTHGIILTSRDGLKWNKVQINNNSTFRSVACTNDKWLLLTIEGKKEIIEDSKIEG